MIMKLVRIKGFDIKSLVNPYAQIEFLSGANNLPNNIIKTYWFLSESNFAFYFDGKPLDSNREKYCNQTLLAEMFYFKQIQSLEIQESVRFTQKVCPLVFTNSNVSLLLIKQLINTLLNKNLLTFAKNVTAKESIHSVINIVFVTCYRVYVNDDLFNKYVFKTMKFLELTGQIEAIEKEVFKQFEQLKLLRLGVQYLTALFHKDTRWLNSLNTHIIIKPNKSLPASIANENAFILIFFQTFSDFAFYDFPNEDICLFKDFPHRHFVLPKLYPDEKSTCTCT